MKKTLLWAALLALVAAPSLARADHGHDNPGGVNILSFDTMYGVDGPLLGEEHAIRGVVGDEAPWTIAHSIRGRLTTSGRLQILVRGLVFADDPLVPPDLIGKNDETEYRGLVSCLTEDPIEGIVTANVTTHGFAADTLGNSFIDETLKLPNPCIAPIVFVMAGSEDKWFAVTGFEAEEHDSEHSAMRGH